MFGCCAIVSAGGLMCTVSFLPTLQGFSLAMNRDENRDRAAALAPAVVELGSRRAIFPREPTGGTWISINDAGVCLALINWHRIERSPKHEVVSRGEIIRNLAGASTAGDIGTAVVSFALRKVRPFRLIAVASSEKRISEFRWNLQRLTRRNHEWRPQHWFSSGFDELRVERERAKVCESAGVNSAGYSLSWLRRLHRSHAPKRGAFSICMHRADARTVSYTEVTVSKQRATMRYKSGPSCSSGSIVTRTISLAHGL
jgi:hypothetical protein